MQPLVSIVIPMRNAEQYIAATLDSILSQSYPHFEIVIVDDGSTDNSKKVVENMGDPRIRVVAGPQSGISGALNTGLGECQGEIIMRCDSDDLMTPDRIARQVEWLGRHPDFDALCGSYFTIDNKGRKISSLNTGAEPEEITSELQKGITRTHLCTYAIKKNALLKAGDFRPEFKTAEDIDMQLRLSETCRVWYQPSDEYQYRLHDTSITHSTGDSRRLYFDELARTLQKQRLSTGSDCIQRGEPLPEHEPSSQQAGRSSQKHIFDQLIGEAWRQHQSGQKRDAIHLGLRALRLYPTSIGAWKNLISLLLKHSPT